VTGDPRVSIVIPVYNGSNYLRRAVDSALAQTWRNAEVLVVNDGSDDGGLTREIALSYGDRIVYLEKGNGGVATALNEGIRAMTGDWFSWLSHDDEYLPDKLETQMRVLREVTRPGEDPHPVLYSDYEVIDGDSRRTGIVRFDHDLLTRKPLYALLRGCLNGCTLLVPREAFEACGPFDPALRTTQDYEMWSRLIRRHPFVHVPRCLIRSRRHGAQDSVRPEHAAEGSRLWIGMMDSLTAGERAALDRSDYLYYRRMACFLRRSPYAAAFEHAERKAREALADPAGGWAVFRNLLRSTVATVRPRELPRLLRNGFRRSSFKVARLLRRGRT